MNLTAMHLILTFAGAIPFVVLSILNAYAITLFPLLSEPLPLLASYGLCIAVFLNGIHWGQQISEQTPKSWPLLITSNINTVFCWLTYITLSLPHFLYALVIIFMITLLIDYYLLKTNRLIITYFLMRLVITTIVIVSLLIAALGTVIN